MNDGSIRIGIILCVILSGMIGAGAVLIRIGRRDKSWGVFLTGIGMTVISAIFLAVFAISTCEMMMEGKCK